MKILKNRKIVYIITALLVIYASYLLYFLYYTNFMPVIARLILALMILLLVGLLIQGLNNLTGSYGIFLVKSKKGVKGIARIAAKHKRFWEAFAEWGMIIGFGILSYPLLKGKTSKKMFLFGFISLIVIAQYILPFMAYASMLISIPQLQSRIPQPNLSQPLPSLQAYLLSIANNSLYGYVEMVLYIIFGFSSFVFIALLYNSGSVLLSLSKVIESVIIGKPTIAPLSSQIPGVAPIIPGITIPLFAGIVSLAILLSIHEFSHGVLASLAKIKLKYVGLIVFGVIPIGAFVEVDEKKIKKRSKVIQNNISIAGVSANFLAMLVFFIPLLVLIPYVFAHVYTIAVFVDSVLQGYPAYGVLSPGMQILSWNGQRTTNMTELQSAASNDKPGSLINVTTNTGTYSLLAKSEANSTRGAIGITAYQQITPVTDTIEKSAAYMLYSICALSVLLNFLVGAFNLLPFPSLDGWRIYKTSVRNKKIVKALAAIIIIALILNALPWL